MNNKYVIRVEHPLVRPGLTIETEASEKYVVPVARALMDFVRAINEPPFDPMKHFKDMQPV